MGVKEKRLEALIALLNEKGKVSPEEIESELGIKRRSVKKYIAELKSDKYDIESGRGYYQMNSLKEGMVFGIDDVRLVTILEEVMDAGEIRRESLIKRAHVKDVFSEMSEKTVTRAIQHCVDQELIRMTDKGSYRLHEDLERALIVDEDDLFSIISYYEQYQDFIYFSKEVKELVNQIIEIDDYSSQPVNIFSIGRPYRFKNQEESILSLFIPYDYRNKKLKIVHDSRIGLLTAEIEVLTFLYHVENDKQYVAGYVDGEFYFILYNTIQLIAEMDQPNTKFANSRGLEIIEKMFGASHEKEYQVKVVFDDLFNIKERVKKLKSHRKFAKITSMGDTFIYEDTMYSLHDFARYLRSYGAACRVVEPIELKDIMKASYERILRNYGELDG